MSRQSATTPPRRGATPRGLCLREHAASSSRKRPPVPRQASPVPGRAGVTRRAGPAYRGPARGRRARSKRRPSGPRGPPRTAPAAAYRLTTGTTRARGEQGASQGRPQPRTSPCAGLGLLVAAQPWSCGWSSGVGLLRRGLRRGTVAGALQASGRGDIVAAAAACRPRLPVGQDPPAAVGHPELDPGVHVLAPDLAVRRAGPRPPRPGPARQPGWPARAIAEAYCSSFPTGGAPTRKPSTSRSRS